MSNDEYNEEEPMDNEEEPVEHEEEPTDNVEEPTDNVEEPIDKEELEEEPQQEPEEIKTEPKKVQMKEVAKEASKGVPRAASRKINTAPSGNIPTNLDPASAWKAVSADPPSINWYLFGLDKKMDLTFKHAGQNGLVELADRLKSSSSDILFGLLRVNTNDDQSGGTNRAKFVFVRFVGASVSVMQKAKLTPKLGKISESFPVKHLSYDLTDDLTNFTVETLSKEFLRVGGKHYSFEFGPNQIYVCK